MAMCGITRKGASVGLKDYESYYQGLIMGSCGVAIILLGIIGIVAMVYYVVTNAF